MSKRQKEVRFYSVIGDWTSYGGKLHRDLASAIQAAIGRGDLVVGDRLPSERQMSSGLKVSRTTVVKALSQLKDRNLIASRIGSGWVVAGERCAADRDRTPRVTLRLAPGAPPRENLIDFSSVAPAAPNDLAEILARSASSVFAERDYRPQGLGALREFIAGRYQSRGVPTAVEQIIVTSGAQQAICIAAGIELSRADRVLVEDPTFYGAMDAYTLTGARLVGVPLCRDGIDTLVLDHLVRSVSPRLLHVSPSFQNPTGVCYSDAVKEEIAKIADRTGMIVVEDDTMHDLWFSDEPRNPIVAFSEQDRVINIGSFSKSIWAGLRVGWMRVPAAEIAKYIAFKSACDLGTSSLSQALLCAALPEIERLIGDRRIKCAAGVKELSSKLNRCLPDWSFDLPQGGAFLWVTLPNADAGAFQRTALRHGVSCVDGSVLSLGRSPTRKIRLSCPLDNESISEGVERLRAAWTEPAIW